MGYAWSQAFFDVDYSFSPFPEHNVILEAWYGVSEALLQLLLSEGYLIESLGSHSLLGMNDWESLTPRSE